jgi:hypothetical protein
MKLNFSHVLTKYEKGYEVTRTPDEQIINGRVVEGTPITETLKLIMFPLRPEQINDYEGGAYTTQDRKIYQREGSIMPLKEHDIIYDSRNDKNYEVREKTSWLDFADFSTFVAKKVVVE